VKANVAGIWLKNRKEPLWVMGSLEPDEILEIYNERMKIEQSFRDNKSLLNLEQVMSKRRGHLRSTLALVLLAYGLGLMIGEAARDEAYGGDDSEGGEKRGSPPPPPRWPGESGSSTRDCSC